MIVASTVWENDAFLAELSAIAPAQPPQISGEAIDAAKTAFEKAQDAGSFVHGAWRAAIAAALEVGRGE